jgi:hypothetical protein
MYKSDMATNVYMKVVIMAFQKRRVLSDSNSNMHLRENEILPRSQGYLCYDTLLLGW